VSQDVEPVVRAGPGPVANGGSGLDAFLQAMNKLQLAQEYFEKNNPQSVELENVVSFRCLVPDIVQVEIIIKLPGKFWQQFMVPGFLEIVPFQVEILE
jgi:hypothetical protein